MNIFKQAAIKILKKSKKALHYKEITKRALEEGILVTNGLTPAASMNSTIISDINKNGETSIFIKVSPSTYTLNLKMEKEKSPKKIPYKKTKSTGIIKAYAEKLSYELLENKEYKKIILEEIIKNKHGIYALYKKNDKLYYVGLAKDLKDRLSKHLIDKHSKQSDYFSFYLVDNSNYLKELESFILRIINPVGNKEKGNFKNAKDLQEKMIKVYDEYTINKKKSIFNSKKIKKKGKNNVGANIKNIHFPLEIKLEYKKKIYKAKLIDKNGSIEFKKLLFATPSGAAKEVTGTHVNGWNMWKYKNSKDQWVLIKNLRNS